MTRYPVGTNAFATDVVVATQGRRLCYASCFNGAGATRYLQVFDATELPADGAVPLTEIPIAAASLGVLDFGYDGLPMSGGIVLALSTTAASLTVTLANDGLFCAVHR